MAGTNLPVKIEQRKGSFVMNSQGNHTFAAQNSEQTTIKPVLPY
jgi:hypothetical protein